MIMRQRAPRLARLPSGGARCATGLRQRRSGATACGRPPSKRCPPAPVAPVRIIAGSGVFFIPQPDGPNRQHNPGLFELQESERGDVGLALVMAHGVLFHAQASFKKFCPKSGGGWVSRAAIF